MTVLPGDLAIYAVAAAGMCIGFLLGYLYHER